MSNNNEAVCCTPKCGKPAPMQCPKCRELNITSHFCSQECFKNNYADHKAIHKVQLSNGNAIKEESLVVPFPNFYHTGTLRPYKQSPKRTVPLHIPRPDYGESPTGSPVSEIASKSAGIISCLSKEEIEGVRVACKLGREILDIGARMVQAGVTTDEIDRVIHEACIERDCYPSPLNYYKFPKSCCTSVNEVICHGIPDMRPLENGDIVNIDVTVYHKGFHGDLNETFFVGRSDADSIRVVETAYECLDKAIQLVKPGVKYRDVGNVIQKHASARGCSVVKTYCGHGIHSLFHCAPTVPHYAKNKAVGIMKPGHCFTIEPMINLGRYADVLWPDNWTSVTCDGKRSAQFEHTLVVTETGCEVLTRRHNDQPWFKDQLKSLETE